MSIKSTIDKTDDDFLQEPSAVITIMNGVTNEMFMDLKFNFDKEKTTASKFIIIFKSLLFYESWYSFSVKAKAEDVAKDLQGNWIFFHGFQ